MVDHLSSTQFTSSSMKKTSVSSRPQLVLAARWRRRQRSVESKQQDPSNKVCTEVVWRRQRWVFLFLYSFLPEYYINLLQEGSTTISLFKLAGKADIIVFHVDIPRGPYWLTRRTGQPYHMLMIGLRSKINNRR